MKLKIALQDGGLNMLEVAIQGVLLAHCYLLGQPLVDKGALPAEELVLFATLTVEIVYYVYTSLNALQMYVEHNEDANRLWDFLSLPPDTGTDGLQASVLEGQNPRLNINKPPSSTSELVIHFKTVSYPEPRGSESQPTTEEKFILRDLSFTIEPGQFIWITGPSGCGKSTLIDLLLRRRLPAVGVISIGEKNNLRSLENWDQQELYGAMCWISQTAEIFRAGEAGCLDYNINYGNNQQHTTELKAQMKLNNVVEQGKLSGGETARVAAARAFARSLRILIMDEPTSALDPTNATKLIKCVRSLHQQQKGMIVLCVTHQFALIEDNDIVLVLRDVRGGGADTNSLDAMATSRELAEQNEWYMKQRRLSKIQ